MSDCHIYLVNIQIRWIFLMKIVFIHLILENCQQIVFHFQQQNRSNGSDFWSQPKMSGFLQSNVRDPRSQDPDFLELTPVLKVMTTDVHSSGRLTTQSKGCLFCKQTVGAAREGSVK